MKLLLSVVEDRRWLGVVLTPEGQWFKVTLWSGGATHPWKADAQATTMVELEEKSPLYAPIEEAIKVEMEPEEGVEQYLNDPEFVKHLKEYVRRKHGTEVHEAALRSVGKGDEARTTVLSADEVRVAEGEGCPRGGADEGQQEVRSGEVEQKVRRRVSWLDKYRP